MGHIGADNGFWGFVVLHYLAYDMTCRCVDALMASMSGHAFHVAIVDNASPDGSGALLEKRFAGNGCVSVLRNASNIGFARGNNVGYKYLRNNFSCSFIVVMNNDVLVEDPAFASKVKLAHGRTAFDVLGPDIVNPLSGRHQNPAHRDDASILYGYSEEALKALLDKYRKDLEHFRWKRLKWHIKRLLSPSLAEKRQKTGAEIASCMENVVLHGACYIFSERFISLREECFNPGTFLYMEEDILHYECMRDGLKMVYDDSVAVRHLEDVSTDRMLRSADRKYAFKLRESLHSAELLLSLMQREG